MKRIEMTVDTGWANGGHVDYCELPESWDEMTEEQQEEHLAMCAHDYLLECCSSEAQVVEA